MLEELQSDALPAMFISAGILALFVTGELLHRFRGLRVELTRKLSHVGAGLIVLSFPWLLSSPWTVAVLCIAFAGLLAIGKVTGLLSSVHSVERQTGGALLLPARCRGYILALRRRSVALLHPDRRDGAR